MSKYISQRHRVNVHITTTSARDIASVKGSGGGVSTAGAGANIDVTNGDDGYTPLA